MVLKLLENAKSGIILSSSFWTGWVLSDDGMRVVWNAVGAVVSFTAVKVVEKYLFPFSVRLVKVLKIKICTILEKVFPK